MLKNISRKCCDAFMLNHFSGIHVGDSTRIQGSADFRRASLLWRLHAFWQRIYDGEGTSTVGYINGHLGAHLTAVFHFYFVHVFIYILFCLKGQGAQSVLVVRASTCWLRRAIEILEAKRQPTREEPSDCLWWVVRRNACCLVPDEVSSRCSRVIIKFICLFIVYISATSTS